MSLRKQISISPGNAEDIPGIMGLINPRWPPFKPASHYRWLLFDSPASPTIVCAKHNDAIIGLFVIHERQLLSGERCGLVSGLVIEDEYRGLGLFSKLGSAAVERSPSLDMLCSIANQNGSHALNKNFGYEDWGPIHTYALHEPQREMQHKVSVEAISEDTMFPGEIALPPSVTGFSATNSFQSWRYGTGSRYTFYKITALDGSYLVIKLFPIHDDEKLVGDVMGIYARHWDASAIVSLVSSGIAAMNAKGVQDFYGWGGPNDPYIPLLQEAGFETAKPTRRLCVLPLKKNSPASSWHVSMSDSLR